MGFESSRIARRRLASLAATNDRVHEALSPSSFPGLFVSNEPPGDAAPAAESFDGLHPHPSTSETVSALALQLDQLARDIVATPGAGGALLSAYAAQARALTMVIEAARRAGDSPLPSSVLVAAQEALQTPNVLSGIAMA